MTDLRIDSDILEEPVSPDEPRISNVNMGLRNIAAAILIALGLLFVWEIRGTLLLTFAAVILVVLFTMPVRLLIQRFEMKRPIAIIVSVIGFFVALGLIGVSILPAIVGQFGKLSQDVLPSAWAQVQGYIASGALFDTLPAPLRDALPPSLRDPANFQLNDDMLNQLVSQVTDLLGRVGGSVLPVVGGVANTVLSALIIFFMSMYLLAEPELYVNGLIKLTPKWYRGRVRVVLQRVDQTLRAWLSVTGVSMIVVGLGTGLGLSLLGIEVWLALGVLAGILSFIPNFGPLVALVPAVAAGIAQEGGVNVLLIGAIIAIVYGVSFFQSQVLSPVLARERMNMPAILILLGQILFGFFFGFLGIMLAVPLSAVVAVLVDEIYVKDILGDRGKEKVDVEPEDESFPDDAS